MKLKQIFTIWLAIYPLITALSYLLGPYLKQMPKPLSAFVMTSIVVPVTVHWGIPKCTKLVCKFDNLIAYNKSAKVESEID